MGERRGRTGRMLPQVLLALVGLGTVLWLTLRAAEQTSPGELSAVHAALPELRGSDGCAGCHGEQAGARGLDTACLTCHTAIETQINSASGLHGKLGADQACGSCHSEHRGRDWALVQDATFVRLGWEAMAAFDHDGLDYALHGAHEHAECQDCHPNALDRVLAAGQPRFLGLSQDCTSCHEDAHDGAMSSACALCHGQEHPWDTAPEFQHTEDFPLDGAHAQVRCEECHAPGSPSSVQAALENPGGSVRDCVACHDSAHEPAFAGTSSADCLACHTTENHGFQQFARELVREQHAGLGFALVDRHGEADCQSCHGPSGDFRSRYRLDQQCASCHDDPHGDAFAGGTLAAAVQGRDGCVRCHAQDSKAWTPAPHFDHAMATGIALEGAHALLDCRACHSEGTTARLGPVEPAGRGMDCARCHSDPHDGQFAADRSPLAALGPPGRATTDCASCHNVASFTEVEAFDHSRTGMELTGAHQRIDCRDCHLHPREVAARLGRATPPKHVGPATCETCHADPHGARFDAVGLPSQLEGRSGCERCHSTHSFREVPSERFDHGLWTRFALEGAHRQVRCTACHGATADGDLRVNAFAQRGTAGGWTCGECHASPHGKTFVTQKELCNAAGQVRCDLCHVAASFRAVAKFDHGTTGFALEGQHAAAQCTACHRATQAQPETRRLPSALGANCSDCHRDPHLGQFGQPASCQECHSGSQQWNIPSFDHDRTSFPLDAAHAKVACASCHKPATTADGQSAVRYRPLGRRCADCHRGGGGEDR